MSYSAAHIAKCSSRAGGSVGGSFVHRRENSLHLSYCNRDAHKREKRAPFSPCHCHDYSLHASRQGYLAGLLLPWIAYRCPIMDTAGMTSMENRRHFLLVFRLGMSFPRDEGTTETKTANAKKEQHLFFFLFVSFDTAAAFFLSKEAMLCFSKG